MAQEIEDRDLRQTDVRGTTTEGPRPPASSRPVDRDDDRRKKRGIWAWLLPLLGLLVLAAILIPLLTGGDDEAATTGNGQGNGAAAADGAGAGRLTAGGQDVMGDPASLGEHVGGRATGEDLRVLSVVRDGGFFVGRSEADRMYIEYGGKYGPDEKTGLPQVGDRVDVVGKVRPAPADPVETLEVGADDAAEITRDGAFINADRVTAAGN